MTININYQKPLFFIPAGLLLTAIWGLTGYYILGPFYLIMSPLFYLALFLLGILFRLPNSHFILFIYILVFGSNLIGRIIVISEKIIDEYFFSFLVFYILELIVLTLKKLSMDAGDQGWSKDQKWINRGIAILCPLVALLVYYIITRQLFVFEK